MNEKPADYEQKVNNTDVSAYLQIIRSTYELIFHWTIPRMNLVMKSTHRKNLLLNRGRSNYGLVSSPVNRLRAVCPSLTVIRKGTTHLADRKYSADRVDQTIDGLAFINVQKGHRMS